MPPKENGMCSLASCRGPAPCMQQRWPASHGSGLRLPWYYVGFPTSAHMLCTVVWICLVNGLHVRGWSMGNWEWDQVLLRLILLLVYTHCWAVWVQRVLRCIPTLHVTLWSYLVCILAALLAEEWGPPVDPPGAGIYQVSPHQSVGVAMCHLCCCSYAPPPAGDPDWPGEGRWWTQESVLPTRPTDYV